MFDTPPTHIQLRNTVRATRKLGRLQLGRLQLACALLGFHLISAASATTHSTWEHLKASTHTYHLPNQLKLIVREDTRAPVAVVQIWYKVGSSYEPHSLNGISHLLEHMMFKGTHALKPGETSEWIAKLGGQENAFTSKDYTAYYQMWSKHHVALSFAIEADRLQNLQFLPEEFATEHPVVIEERRQRTEDNPNSLAYERFQAAAYPASPYRQPVIGWMHTLTQLTLADTKAWYEKWYHPNNATLIVVGDVIAEEVYQQALTHFGHINAHPLPSRPPTQEIRPLGKRELEVHLPAKLPQLLLGFNVPSLTSAQIPPEDTHALYMLSALLDGGQSARLPQSLVREQRLAAQVASYYNPFSRGDTLFSLSATPSAGISLQQLTEGLWAEIERIKTTPPSAAELSRIKAQLLASLVYQQDSLSHQANQIGRLESLDLNWETLFELVDGVNTTTPQQIQAVAQTYLVEPRLTRAKLIPTE